MLQKNALYKQRKGHFQEKNLPQIVAYRGVPVHLFPKMSNKKIPKRFFVSKKYTECMINNCIVLSTKLFVIHQWPMLDVHDPYSIFKSMNQY